MPKFINTDWNLDTEAVSLKFCHNDGEDMAIGEIAEAMKGLISDEEIREAAKVIMKSPDYRVREEN